MNEILTGKICPYCGKPTEYVDSSIIYGRSYGMIYLCRDAGLMSVSTRAQTGR